MRTILALLAVVALFGCRSSRSDKIDPNVQTSVTNTPAATVPVNPNNTTGTVVEAKGTAPQSAALPTVTPELNVKTENPPMASAAQDATTTTTTKSTTTTTHKKVRKD
ncbi:MAG: hypothetical protein AABO58_01170 [Acidobacteriota bacterium]